MRLHKNINIFFIFLCLFAFSSCEDEGDELEQISTAFIGKYGSSIKAGQGDVVKLAFSKPLLENSSVLIGYRSNIAQYGKDFITSPQSFREGEFRVNANAGDIETEFTFDTFIDENLEDGFDIEFFIKEYSGSLFSVASTSVYRVEVSPAPIEIAELRGRYTGVDAPINEKTIVEGIVVSSLDGNTNIQNLAIQDATGAIILRFNSEHNFRQGFLVEVSVRGGNLTDFRDLVQVEGLDVDAVTVLDSVSSTLPEPKVVTIEEFNSDAFQSQYVEIQNISFVDADGTATFVGGNNYVITDGANETEIRANSVDAPFVGQVIPSGNVAVRGIAGIFRGNTQLLPQKAGDIIE